MPFAAPTTDEPVVSGFHAPETDEPAEQGFHAPDSDVTPLAPRDKFDTQLSRDDEDHFEQWREKYAPNDSGADYDLRGAFKDGLKPNANHHWPDTYKKPNHPTFSVESKYANDAREKAGHWDGDTYVPPTATSGVRLNPYEQANLDGQRDPGMSSGTELTTALGTGLENAPETLAEAAGTASHTVGKVAKTILNIPVGVYNAAAYVTRHGKPLDYYKEGESVLPPEAQAGLEQFAKDAVGSFIPGMDKPLNPEGTGYTSPASEGLGRSAGKLVSGFTAPEGIALLPLASEKFVLGLFGLQQAATAPKMVKDAVQVFSDPQSTAAQKWEALGDAGTHVAMTAAIALHLSPEKVKASMAPEEAVVQLGSPKPEAVPDFADQIAPVAPMTAEALKETAPAEQPPTPKDTPDEIQNATAIEEAAPAPNALNVPAGSPETQGDAGRTLEAAGEGEVTPELPPAGDVAPPPEQAARSDAYSELLAGLPPETADAISSIVAKVERGKDLTAEEQQLMDAVTKSVSHRAQNEMVANKVRTHGWQSLTDEDIAALEPEQKAVYDRWLEAGRPAGGGEIETGNISETEPQNIAGSSEANPAAEEVSEKPFGEGPGSASVAQGPDTGGAWLEGNGADKYGIAARVREERAAAGQVELVEPGTGISAPESVLHGRELIKDGVQPEEVLAGFEANGKLSADDMAVVRAHGEALALAARRIEEQFGTDSDEYRAAFKALSDWDARTKAMQTEWHKTGMAQQGETDIDTGTFTGLQREHVARTGEDFNPKQAREARTIAGRVRKAADEAAEAKQKLANQLRTDTGPANAEAAALAAAAKTVRDAAARAAEAENRVRVAEAAREKAVAKVRQEAEARALRAAAKTVRDAAARAAEAESKARAKAAAAKNDAAGIREAAAKKALASAAKAVRDAAAKAAELESKKRELAAKKAAETAQVELERARKSKASIDKFHRDAAARAAALERKRQADPIGTVLDAVKQYLDRGEENFDDIRNKVATDLGMTVEQVTRLLGRNQRAKFLTNDAWRKQQKVRRMQEQAKRWVKNLSIPGYKRAIASIPRILFGLKVGFHGTVALGTHAPAVAFQPPFWKTYVTDFAKMYRMVGSPTYYEMQVQDLLRRPNYITANRAGLVNDPFVFEDYNSPDVAQYIGRLSGMGNRGYAILKVLRQDMFDQMWNKLPRTAQIPEVAQSIADGLNHATGVVKFKVHPGFNVALFAPRLELSRLAWLAGDPLKAADTFLRWKEATPGEKHFAINQVKEKAWVLGTLFSMLAANQGFLSATGSNQKINVTDPFKGDYLKFKVGGMTLSYGNPLVTVARLPVRLWKIRESDGGKLKNLVYADEDTAKVLFEYARSQASPFAGLALDLFLKSDWMNRQLPGSKRPEPKRLKAEGIKPYTWPEFWSEQLTPIPVSEALREVWQTGLGMNPEQVKQLEKALATIAVTSATGARLTDDWDLKTPKH